jgi:phage-related protein
VNPKILNRTYDVFMQFICTLANDDYLKIDVLEGTATIHRTDGSTEDALLVLTNNSEFFYLLSGENEVVFLEESGVPPVNNYSYAQIEWSDTWL